jgi:hypothetical protein
MATSQLSWVASGHTSGSDLLCLWNTGVDSSLGDMAKPEEWGRYPLMTTMPPSPSPPLRELHTGVNGEGTTLAEPLKENTSVGQAEGCHLVFKDRLVQPPVKTDNVVPRWGGGEDKLSVWHGGR